MLPVNLVFPGAGTGLSRNAYQCERPEPESTGMNSMYLSCPTARYKFLTEENESKELKSWIAKGWKK